MGEFFSMLPKEVWVTLISMVPIIELRGAIPVAIALGMPWLEALLLCCIGNILPAPFIIAYMKPIFRFLKKSKLLRGLVEKVEHRTAKKAEKAQAENAEKKSKQALPFLAIYLFVAIPLPGTGAWTGSMIAALLDMRVKHALPAVALGVLTAGIIMLCASLLGVAIF